MLAILWFWNSLIQGRRLALVFCVILGDCLREEQANPDSPYSKLIDDCIRNGDQPPSPKASAFSISDPQP